MGKVSKLNKINFKEMTGIVPIGKGGTGKGNIPEFADSLNGIKFNQRNAANGVAGLNIHTKLDKELFDIKSISINGNDTIQVNSVATYNIVNYSSFNEYDISVSSGSFTVAGGVISYTAPSQPETVIMTVNGRQFVLNIVPIVAYVVTPNVITPVNGSLNLGPNISFTSNAFEASGGVDTHESSDWQIATDANFSNIVASVTDDVNNKTSWNVSNLVTNTGFYVRVRYKGTNMGYSNWSVANSFTTKTSYLPVNEEAKLTASDKASSDRFAYSVDINSNADRVVIGAYLKDISGFSDTGCAYIFNKINGLWVEEAQLSANDKAAVDYFGYSVSIDSNGDRVAISAYRDDSYKGSVYIFSRSGTTWSQEAKLIATDAAINDYFGWSVEIDASGDRVAVGAFREDTTKGAVYIFSRTGIVWTEETKIVPNPRISDGYFGSSVAINSTGDRIAVGSYLESSGFGAVYVFSRSGTTWSQEARLLAGDYENNKRLGSSVSIDSTGTRIIAMSFAGGVNYGSAYIFTRSGTTWSQEAILTKSSPEYFDYTMLGPDNVSINANGDRVVIGFDRTNDSGFTESGLVLLFTRSGTTWTQEAVLFSSDIAGSDNFGNAVSLNSTGDTLVIGSSGEDPGNVSNAGSAYIFS